MKKKGILLGFKRAVSSKSNKRYCILHVSMPYEERDLLSGACGTRGEEIFCPEEQIDYVTSEDVGREIEITYVISNNRLYVDGIVVNRK